MKKQFFKDNEPGSEEDINRKILEGLQMERQMRMHDLMSTFNAEQQAAIQA